MDVNNLGRNMVFPIFNEDGTSFHDLILKKATVDSVIMSLGDKITGDVYYKDNKLVCTMKEYVVYKGVKYLLANPPTIVREGMVSDNNELNGMTKYSFEFYHPMYKLGNLPFTDVAVSSDELRYKSQDKTFSWIGYLRDFVDKLNKNLQNTEWFVALSDKITEDKLSTLSEVLSFDNNYISDALKTAYDTWEVPFVIDQISEGDYYYVNTENETVDYYSEGKRFVILFGLPSNEILVDGEELDYEGVKSVFDGTLGTIRYNGSRYWGDKSAIEARKGQRIQIAYVQASNGTFLKEGFWLYKVNATSDSDTITSLGELLGTDSYTPQEDCFVVVGTQNIPPYNITFRTYDLIKEPYVFQFGKGVGLKNNSATPKNNKIVTRLAGYGSEDNIPYGYPQVRWYGDQSWKYTINNDSSNPNSYPIYEGILGGQYVKLIKHPFTRNNLMPSIYAQTLFNKISPYLERDISPSESGVVSYNQTLSELKQMLQSLIRSTSSDIDKHAYHGLLSALNHVEETKEAYDFSGSDYNGHIGIESDGNLIGYVVGENEFEFESVYVEGWHTFDLVANPYYDPSIELIDYYDADNSDIYPNVINLNSPSFEIHQFEDVKPELGEASIIDAFPYKDSIKYEAYCTQTQFVAKMNEMIETVNDEIIKGELEHIRDHYKTMGYHEESRDTEDWWLDGAYRYTFERDDYYGYIDFTSSSLNFYYIILMAEQPKDGDYDKFFDDEVDWDDSMDENGEYLQSYFKITLPKLDFDLYACAAITQEMQINMRSGACIGCTFTIQVDWDNYKLNFYDVDGNFVPRGDKSRRDFEQYPDSSKEEITVIVQKDIDTFGTLMPNIYQQPKAGDKFVILGISLPQSYVTRAQERLDEDMKEYLLENNVYYFDYPLKFDPYFLAKNVDILSQIRNNTIVRFMFANKSLALYVKQITIKYGDDVLPQYDITLTDDVEVVLNKIGQVTDDVSRLRVQVSALQSYYQKEFIEELHSKLSRTEEDSSEERITFNKGLALNPRKEYSIDENGVATLKEIVSKDFEHGFNGGGFSIKETDGAGVIETDSLIVRKKMSVAELEVLKKQYTGGNLSIGAASCTVEKVVEKDSGRAYRLYFKASDGTQTSQNLWEEGDMARCQTFNLLEGTTYNVQNRYWWRLVIDAGTETIGDETYNYIDVSNNEAGENEPDTEQVGEGKTAWAYDGSVVNDIPQAGDIVVQEGNVLNADRQNLITIDVFGDDAPCIIQYQGIGSDTSTFANQYNLSNYRRTTISPNGNKFIAKSFIIEVSDEEGNVSEFNLASEKDLSALTDGLRDLRSEFTITTNAIEQKVSANGGRNLFTGIEDGDGWENAETSYIEGEMFLQWFDEADKSVIKSPLVSLDPNKIYCVSVYSLDPDTMTILIDGKRLEDVNNGTQESYDDCSRYYLTFTNASSVVFQLDTMDGELYYYNPQIEEVDSLSSKPTAWTTQKEELSALIRTEAGAITLEATNQITAKVNNTGVNIDDGTITLSAKNTVIDSKLTVNSLQTQPDTNGQYFKAGGGVCEWYGAFGVANIRAGLDEYGQAILEFYDNSGTLLYNLGAGGLTAIENLSELFASQSMKRYNLDADTPLSDTDWGDVAETIHPRTWVGSVYQYRARQTRTGNTTIYYAGDYCSDNTTAEVANNRMFEKNNAVITYSQTSAWENSSNNPLNGVYIYAKTVDAGTVSIEIDNKGNTWEIVYNKFTEISVYRYKDGLLQENVYASDAANNVRSRKIINPSMDVE